MVRGTSEYRCDALFSRQSIKMMKDSFFSKIRFVVFQAMAAMNSKKDEVFPDEGDHSVRRASTNSSGKTAFSKVDTLPFLMRHKPAWCYTPAYIE